MIVGLTGGIGSGKSTVSELFQNLGIVVVDADQVARDVVKPGTRALAEIQKHFGDEVTVGGELNRAALRQIIFSDATAQKWLEDLLHPLIRIETLKRLKAADSPYAILEAPLLFENDLDQTCHRTILVDIPEDEQRRRASQRDNRTEAEIQKIIDIQMPRADKRKRADYTLDNSLTVEDLKPQVLRLDQILRLMAANPELL